MPSVRFIEPSFTRKNPSTNGLVDVVLDLKSKGWEIELFSYEIEAGLEGAVRHRRAPLMRLPANFSPWGYFFFYHWKGLLDWLLSRPKPDIIVSTGFMYLPADVATVHFSHFDYFKAVLSRLAGSPELIRNLFQIVPGLLTELLFFWNPWQTLMLPVSRSVASDLADYAAPWKDISVLPNQVCSDRFFPAYRANARDQARQLHGLSKDETILLFASAGHHFRKGFFQAVEVISQLREREIPVRMLVVGGREATLKRLKNRMSRSHPGSDKWLIFTGDVDNPEFHFSAADALFFPSHSEAFSLVEIEAAALGLPLYLTPHHGSEMILRDTENGRLLPWDIQGMADILSDEIVSSRMHFTGGSSGEALSKSEYSDRWLSLLSDALPAIGPAEPIQITKPRLLLIGHTYGISVNRKKAVSLARYFQTKVCTCDLEGWKVLGEEVTDTEPAEHWGSYSLSRLRRWPRWQDYTKIFFRGLLAEMHAFKPDVILIENEPWSMLRWQTRIAAWMIAPEARFVEFTWENVRRPGMKGHILSMIYRLAGATGDILICGNQGSLKICLEAGYPTGTTFVAPQLGIDPKDYSLPDAFSRAAWRSSLGWPEDSIVVGFCGRLVSEKGLYELTHAIQILRAEFPKLRLALLGEGELRPALQQIDPEGEWMRILPAVPHEEIPTFLNKLDIFTLPSKPMTSPDGNVWQEQFGHVLLESMASATLTLGSDSGAIPEVLNDPEVTFNHSDVGALTAMLRKWLQDPSARMGKAHQQRESCMEIWSHGAVATSYARILLPFIGNGSIGTSPWRDSENATSNLPSNVHWIL